ncbi:hypothetical protein BJY04DRAFT_202167 [Aspergillus karnatakaensis]|uniref:uncharacterized protein n=1 Tax=Aspergillus karnatakaensis TaxID=1810916 RepID=UPI003CCDE27A
MEHPNVDTSSEISQTPFYTPHEYAGLSYIRDHYGHFTVQGPSSANNMVDSTGTGDGWSNATTLNATFPTQVMLSTSEHPNSYQANHQQRHPFPTPPWPGVFTMYNVPGQAGPDTGVSQTSFKEINPTHGSMNIRTRDNRPSSHPRAFRCQWKGCHSTTIFHREADIMRHIRSIHLAPDAYPCLENGCKRSFGRKDYLQEHVRRCHSSH